MGQLPRYVTIIGGPEEVPWAVQYAFEARHAVGRLPLDDAGLANYIEALLNNFPHQDVDMRAPLMWTVSHAGDITAEMRAVISTPLEVALTDPQLPTLRAPRRRLGDRRRADSPADSEHTRSGRDVEPRTC